MLGRSVLISPSVVSEATAEEKLVASSESMAVAFDTTLALHRTDDLTPANVPDATSAIRLSYLNCDIARNIITRCQLLMFSILTWQLRHCGVTEVLPASFCWLL